MKKYRFFYHFYRQKGCMSVHFRNKCIPVQNVRCEVESETKWNKRQPMLVLQGFAEDVIIDGDTAIIK